MTFTYEERKRMLDNVPVLAVDGAVFKEDRILLIRRNTEPYKGYWALPGGFLDKGETLQDGCKREVKEETGVSISIKDTIGIYDDPKRDPRGHIITVAFLAEARTFKIIADPKEIMDAAFFDLIPSNIVPSAKSMIQDALKLRKQSL